MKTFFAHEVALEAIRQLKNLLPILKLFDPDLEKHVRKAANSMVLCLGEGNRRKGKDKIHLFSISAGSADEITKVLILAEAWGYMNKEQINPALFVLDRFLGILWRLTNGRIPAKPKPASEKTTEAEGHG